ncbi:hypothetical protein [Arthrobacter sp. PM3]|uniref:hypothetical protein n=1 Tax=Arthrobacter sp. PM3 TaxID=2017685 RepID=UPI000E10D0E8|nr:hypothetical protein [Arthrobacter sp. PM3]AXJ10134.1 hypothetical protein CFN17_11225 [Arthrobacter sp. PM3]
MYRTTVFPALALAAALAAGVTLSSCAAPAQRAGEAGTGPAGTAASSPAQSSGPAAAAEPSATAAVPAPAPTATSPATPTAAPVAGVKTFTFPDGHLSFSYPSDWSIRMVGAPENAAKLRGVQAVIADATGNELASVTSSTSASSASGPVARTVLDAAPVPGLKDVDGEQLAAGFAFDSFADQSDFHMGVRKQRDFAPSVTEAGNSHVQFPNGGAEAKVLFGNPAFPSVDAARAWMTTEQYSQLKRLLLSLKYS